MQFQRFINQVIALKLYLNPLQTGFNKTDCDYDRVISPFDFNDMCCQLDKLPNYMTSSKARNL